MRKILYVRDESGRRSAGHPALLVAGGMAVAGVSLIVGGLMARAIFERGSLGGTKGTFWRKVLFIKGGKGTAAPRVPSAEDVEMLRKKTGLK